MRREICSLGAGALASTTCGSSSTQVQAQVWFLLGHKTCQESDSCRGLRLHRPLVVRQICLELYVGLTCCGLQDKCSQPRWVRLGIHQRGEKFGMIFDWKMFFCYLSTAMSYSKSAHVEFSGFYFF